MHLSNTGIKYSKHFICVQPVFMIPTLNSNVNNTPLPPAKCFKITFHQSKARTNMLRCSGYRGFNRSPNTNKIKLNTLMVLVANLTNIKYCKILDKSLKPWHMGTHLRVLSESYPMNTNMTWLRWVSKIFASLCFR